MEKGRGRRGNKGAGDGRKRARKITKNYETNIS
jgi:hypothetical protein